MQEYRIKMKQIVVIEKSFVADTDDEALEKAKLIHLQTDDSEFEDGRGEREYDYALTDENGRDLVYWDI